MDVIDKVSLTNFLRDKENRKAIKSLIKLPKKPNLKTSHIPATNKYSVVGHSYEFLLKALLQREYGEYCTKQLDFKN